MSIWSALAGGGAGRPHRAVWKLAADPGRSVPYLRKRLSPVSPADARRLAGLVGDLDSPEFATREAATAELQKLGELAAPALRETLTSAPALEVRRRAERLLEKAEGPVTDRERLRALRAVQVLELAGTAEARRVLAAVARGAPEARLTCEARAALERLARAERTR